MTELERLMSATVSRRTIFKGAAVGFAGVALAATGCDAYTPTETGPSTSGVQDALNVLVTVEQFGVTFVGAAIDSAVKGSYNKPFSPQLVSILKAVRAQEQAHLDFFLAAGGKPIVSTFTIPPTLLTDFDALFTAIAEEEALEIATQLASMSSYIDAQRLDLVKSTFQYAAEEAEHRLLANYTLGTRPANDIAFESNPFSAPDQMIDSFKQRGLIGGSGAAVAFPGPGTIDPTNVTNTTPNGPSA